MAKCRAWQLFGLTFWQYAINMPPMSDTDNFHSGLIRDLGGKAKLADALGLDRDVLTKWHVRGIPAKYWDLVIDVGRQLTPPVTVTTAQLRNTKPSTLEAEAA